MPQGHTTSRLSSMTLLENKGEYSLSAFIDLVGGNGSMISSLLNNFKEVSGFCVCAFSLHKFTIFTGARGA